MGRGSGKANLTGPCENTRDLPLAKSLGDKGVAHHGAGSNFHTPHVFRTFSRIRLGFKCQGLKAGTVTLCRLTAPTIWNVRARLHHGHTLRTTRLPSEPRRSYAYTTFRPSASCVVSNFGRHKIAGCILYRASHPCQHFDAAEAMADRREYRLPETTAVASCSYPPSLMAVPSGTRHIPRVLAREH